MNKLTFRKVWNVVWDQAVKDIADVFAEDMPYIDKKRDEAFEAWFKKAQEEEI